MKVRNEAKETSSGECRMLRADDISSTVLRKSEATPKPQDKAILHQRAGGSQVRVAYQAPPSVSFLMHFWLDSQQLVTESGGRLKLRCPQKATARIHLGEQSHLSSAPPSFIGRLLSSKLAGPRDAMLQVPHYSNACKVVVSSIRSNSSTAAAAAAAAAHPEHGCHRQCYHRHTHIIVMSCT